MSEFASAPGQSNFAQSSAYAAAVQRARQIAAKINPIGSPPEGGGGIKRDLEDAFQPDAKKLAGEGILPPAARPPGLMGYGPESQLLNEEIQVPDKIVGLIIGRGGEQISRLQTESGCKIQMERSRGTAERSCTLTGTRDAISRAKEMVMNIVSTLSRGDGFHGGGGGGGRDGDGGGGGGGGGDGFAGPGQAFAQVMVPGPKVGLIIGKGGETIKGLQDQSGAKMVVVQDSSTQDYEKPLRITGTQQQVDHAKELVYQIIMEKDDRRGGRMDRGGRGGGHFDGPGQGPPKNFDFDGNGPGPGGNMGGNGGMIEILVPRAAVGVVIGKGGEMIKKIQTTTGAKLQFEQGRDDGPGDRKCILTGKPEQCEEARARVDELIDSVLRRDDRRDSGGGGGSGGRGGRERNDRDRRGGEGYGDRGGRNDAGNGRWGGGGGGGRGGGDRGGDRTEITFAVPANRAGFVIGRGGETIKQINAQCGAHCEIDRKLSAVNPNEKVFVIIGTPQQIEEAKRLIIERSGIEDYYGIGGNGGGNGPHQSPIASTAYPNQGGFQAQGWGAGGGGGGPNNSYQWPGAGPQGGNGGPGPGGNPPHGQPDGQVPLNPANGQPDYSLQWAEYYRSMGMSKEADMIEQQAKQSKAMGGGNVAGAGGPASGAAPGAPAGAPQHQQGPTNGAQPDFSAQWAEYYRSMGKVKEAEAIEAQIKLKNVGGGGPPSQGQPYQPQQQQQQYPSFQQGNPAQYYGGAPGGPGPGPYQGYGQGGYGQGSYGQPGSEN